jgi:hypothetical protein
LVADEVFNSLDIVAGSGFGFGKLCNIGIAEVFNCVSKSSSLLFGYVPIAPEDFLIGKKN